MTCKPLITPQDCDQYPTAVWPTPTPTPSPAPVPAGEPTNEPGPPKLFEDSPVLGKILPADLSWSDVGHVATVAGASAGAVLLLTIGFTLASTYLGWRPRKALNWMSAALIGLPGWSILSNTDWSAPLDQFHSGATEYLAGRYVHGVAIMAVLLVPIAWLISTMLITNRRVQLVTHGFQSPAATERALWLQAQREQRAAARLTRYRLPFTSGHFNPHPVLGRMSLEDTAAPPKGRLRMLLTRNETRLILSWIKTREHMVAVASSGKGKTTLMIRLLLSWYVSAWLRHRQWWRLDRPGRPLAMVIDCNGGPESLRAAARLKTWFLGLGAPEQRIGILTAAPANGQVEGLPQRVKLNMWGIPSRDDLRSVLSAMVSGGAVPTTATEKYFHEIRENLIHLIVDAPAAVENGVPSGENLPRSWLEFLSRFDKDKLARLWGGVFDPKVPWQGVPGADLKIAATMEGKQPVLSSTLAEFHNLYRLLGDVFDGDAELTDFDLLYVVLDGVKAPDRARSQFAALGCMLEQLADRDHGRETLLAVDEFSAVSDGKTRADKWVERLRKARIGTIWFAQHWNGLGHDDEQRTSLVAAGSGGALLGGQEDGEQLAKTFGTTRRFELSRKLIGGAAAGDEGNVQAHDGWLIDPNKLRRLGKGDIVHVTGGRARWGRVAALDDATLKNLRPLPGLAAFATPATEPEAGELAPVIDLPKRPNP
ncbi:hypothetical protein [Nocardia sp. NPDC050435]|uniref:hypothetical protein n=1 Tax=Nocardia sp. NPDC050435 TaxID=3155040 RepID=UPI0033E0293B